MPDDEEKLMADAMAQAHSELSVEENARKNDPVDLATIHAFTDPREWRTMSRLDPGYLSRLAFVATKGKVTRSRVRNELVKNIFLMGRSANGWGSDQAASVAKARGGTVAPQARQGFFGRMFGRKEPPL